MLNTLRIGSPAFTIVANCFEKITTSWGLTAFFPKENPPPFFLSLAAFFFLTFIKLVIITFCSLSLNEASSWLRASISPSIYFPAEIPLYEKVSEDILITLQIKHDRIL